MRSANKLVHAHRIRYGNNAQCMKHIVESVVKPAVLYAAELWRVAATKTVNRKNLATMQRPLLMAIVKAYRTTPTAALQVLAGVPPWGIVARELHEESLRNAVDIARAKMDTARAPGITRFLSILRAPGCEAREPTRIFVDARVGDITCIGIVEATQGEHNVSRFRHSAGRKTGCANRNFEA